VLESYKNIFGHQRRQQQQQQRRKAELVERDDVIVFDMKFFGLSARTHTNCAIC